MRSGPQVEFEGWTDYDAGSFTGGWERSHEVIGVPEGATLNSSDGKWYTSSSEEIGQDAGDGLAYIRSFGDDTCQAIHVAYESPYQP
jgi:hypothetical protein